MIKGVTHTHLGPIWYQTEPSDVPYSQKPVSYSKPALDQEIRGNLVHIVSLENSYIISITDVNSSYLVCQINSCIQMTSNHMLMIILTNDVEGILNNVNKTTDSD